MLRVVFALCVLALLHFSAFARNTGPNPQFEAWPELNRYLPPKSSLGKMERFGHDGAALIWGCFYYSEGWKLCYPQGGNYAYAIRHTMNGWELWAKAEREKLLFASDNARKFANDGSLPISAQAQEVTGGGGTLVASAPVRQGQNRAVDGTFTVAKNSKQVFRYLPLRVDEFGEGQEQHYVPDQARPGHNLACKIYDTAKGKWKICFANPGSSILRVRLVYHKEGDSWREWLELSHRHCSTSSCKVLYQSPGAIAAAQQNSLQEEQRKLAQKPAPIRKAEKESPSFAQGIPKNIAGNAERAIGSAIKGLFGR